jgi:hypothetical protein
MFYIIVTGDPDKVIADRRGTPREFPKVKKAHNFINGRPLLRKRDTVIVTGFPKDTQRLKVDI